MYLKTKGAEIQKRRNEAGLTRFGLSQKAGLGSYAIARMEEGLHLVHPLRAKAVADVLQCGIDELFETSNENPILNASGI